MRALDLYCGGVMPQIRDILTEHQCLAKCAFILSARYGLIQADETISTYEEVLTASSVTGLRHSVALKFREHLTFKQPVSLFVFAEPLYFSMLSEALDGFTINRLTWEPDVHSGGLIFLEKLRQHISEMRLINELGQESL